MENLNSDLELQIFAKRYVQFVENSELEDIRTLAWEFFVDYTCEKLDELEFEEVIECIFSSPKYDEYIVVHQLGNIEEDRLEKQGKKLDRDRLSELNWLKDELDWILATGTFLMGSICRESSSEQNPMLNSDLELRNFEKRFVRYVESSEYEDIKYVA